MLKPVYTPVLIAIVAVFSLTVMPFAAQAAQPNIAVVNIQKIMRESKAAEAIRTQIKSKQKTFQNELDQKENELQKEDQELAKQRSVLSQDAFEKKYQEFRQKAADAQKEVRRKRAQLDKGFAEALTKIQKKVTDIVSEVCKEKDLDLALSNTQVLFVDSTLDITDDVLGRLNKQMPNLNVNFN